MIADPCPTVNGPGSLPLEILAVWALYLADAAAMFITYSRVPAKHLYHVSHSGISGGAGRVLVFTNFSMALVGIAVLLVLADRPSNGLTRAAVVLGILLCTPVFWPGVVSQADLDARPINVVAAVGVLDALALTVLLARSRNRRPTKGAQGDPARLGIAAVAVCVSLPWIAAELGVFLDGVPLLGWIFETGHYRPASSATTLVAVHHGHHHGMDGLLLLAGALLLSRVVPSLATRRLRVVLAAYLSLMAAYAIGNMANDFWTEQVWKRGWTSWKIPDVLEPKATVAWGLVVAGAVLIYAASHRVQVRGFERRYRETAHA